MKDFFNGEVKFGPSSLALGGLAVAWCAIFVWQLIETGDPSSAGAATSGIISVVAAGLLGLYRSWQAKDSGAS